MAQVIAQPRRTDRRLYRAAAILFPLVVLAGFGRTYYLAPILGGGRPISSVVVHVHGALMALWVTLFVVQVSLVSARKVRVHQRLGYAAIGLAVLIVGVGTVTAVRVAKYGSASAPPDIPRLQFLAVPMFDLVMFVILFGAAIYFRRRATSHRALMLLTMLNFLPAALARVSMTAVQAFGPLYFFGVPTVLGIAALVIDARQHGRINRVLASGLALLVASFVGRLALMGTPAWLAFAEWAIQFV
jgi:hypothetical protein